MKCFTHSTLRPMQTASPVSTTRLLAVEIGGTKLQIAAGDSSGRILEKVRLSVERAAGAKGIQARLAEVLPRLATKWQADAVGVGFGGPVDWRSGRIACSHHIQGWSEFPLGPWISELCGLPVSVDNDANTAALGEAIFGAGRGADPVLWMNAGSGVGGGLVTNGRIYHGASPGEVELGHLRLDREGTITEELCSGWSIDKMVLLSAQEHPESPLAQAATLVPGAEARALTPALQAGDKEAERILGEVSTSMAYALSHAAHLLHPQVIVLGGGVALLGEPLRARVAHALPRWLMSAFHPGPEIRLAALMEDAVLAGALALGSALLSPSLSNP